VLLDGVLDVETMLAPGLTRTRLRPTQCSSAGARTALITQIRQLHTTSLISPTEAPASERMNPSASITVSRPVEI
jgi:hypothetical protein